MSGHLLDVNVLLALAWPNHQFHGAARAWFVEAAEQGWSTCAITELGFVRLSSNPRFTTHARTPREAVDLLTSLTAFRGHRFLEAQPRCASSSVSEAMARALGHRQVTDAYLLAVAVHHDTRLATFDRRLGVLDASGTRVTLLEG